MTAPVRLRGEVGERRRGNTTFIAAGKTHYIDDRGLYRFDRRPLPCGHSIDRRQSPSASARVDEIVAHFKAALAELQEQSRADRAEVAGLRAENERLREAVAKAARVIERKDADLIRYAAAGECAHD